MMCYPRIPIELFKSVPPLLKNAPKIFRRLGQRESNISRIAPRALLAALQFSCPAFWEALAQSVAILFCPRYCPDRAAASFNPAGSCRIGCFGTFRETVPNVIHVWVTTLYVLYTRRLNHLAWPRFVGSATTNYCRHHKRPSQ